MAEQSKSKGGSAVKNVVMILFIVAAGLFVWMKVEQRQTISQENQAVALEEGKYEEAIAMFDKLAAKATGEARERHTSNLARCYAGQAEDSPNLSVAQQMELYRQAASYDQSVIKNPVILRALKEAETKLTVEPTAPPAE